MLQIPLDKSLGGEVEICPSDSSALRCGSEAKLAPLFGPTQWDVPINRCEVQIQRLASCEDCLNDVWSKESEVENLPDVTGFELDMAG